MKRVIEFSFLLVLGLIGGALASVPAHADIYAGDGYAFSFSTEKKQSLEALCTSDAVKNHFVAGMGLTWVGLKSAYFSAGDNKHKCEFDLTFNGDDFDQYLLIRKTSCTGPECVEPSNCPVAGETKRLGYTKTEIPSNMNGGEGSGFTINISNSSSVGASIESNGCGYNRVESSKPDCKLFAYDQQGNQRWNCYADYVATGEPATSPPDSGITYSDGSEDGAPNESEGVTDTRQSNTTTTSTTPVTEMVGDQTVTTKADITTENRGDGSVVETRDDVTIITESDGITRTDTQTTTTTTAPDGSQTIETTNNISYTQHPQTIYNIDNSNNQITVSQTPGGSASQTSTTTETYDADGNLTDREESAGPVQGNEDAAQGEERQTCDTNPLMDKCINDFTNTAKGQFGDISTKISSAKTEFQDEWNRIKSEASNKLGFTLNGGGTLQQSIVTVRGIEGDIGITRWVPYFDEFGLAALVMAGAALYAAVVMFRG